jgi:hypothetical protein
LTGADIKNEDPRALTQNADTPPRHAGRESRLRAEETRITTRPSGGRAEPGVASAVRRRTDVWRAICGGTDLNITPSQFAEAGFEKKKGAGASKVRRCFRHNAFDHNNESAKMKKSTSTTPTQNRRLKARTKKHHLKKSLPRLFVLAKRRVSWSVA